MKGEAKVSWVAVTCNELTIKDLQISKWMEDSKICINFEKGIPQENLHATAYLDKYQTVWSND